MRLAFLVAITGSLLALETPAQRALIEDFAAKTYRCQATWDEAGSLATLVLSHHGIDRKDQAEKPGIADDDILKLAGIASLRELTLVKQPITERGYAVVATLPQLTTFWQEYVPDGIAPDFTAPLRSCTGLKVLAIKHNFALNGKITPMADLPDQPDLERLVLDMSSATPEAIDFIVRCPKLRELQLHRTRIDGAGLARIVAALPHLETIWLKPEQNQAKLTCSDLRELRAASRLTTVALHQWGKRPLRFDDGLDHLAAMPGLVEVNFGGSGRSADDPDVAALAQARPDLRLTGLSERKK